MSGVKGQRSGGHNRKSVEALKAAGTFRGDRHGDRETPAPPPGDPVPPERLTALERREWDRMLERMKLCRTNAPIDDAALYQYVQLFGETEGARRERAGIVRQIGQLQREARKLPIAERVALLEQLHQLRKDASKLLNQLRQGHQAMRQQLGDFGMLPSTRNRVQVVRRPSEARNSVADFLAKKTARVPHLAVAGERRHG